MSTLTSYGQSLNAWWQTATPATRVAATSLALLLALGLIAAGMLAASPDYRPIFHGVSGKDASAIENVLREHSITMRFSDTDGTVSVPAKDESSATMYVEAAGILSKDSAIVGIESLDKIGMGTSTEVERKRILTADEGELARKLMRLDPVETAAVTISPGSEASLFQNNEAAPSASVILGLKQGETLNTNQVKGIVNLVAHSVTGLTAQNVTLTDQTGTPLWKDNGVGGNALGDGQPMDEGAKFAETKRRQLQGLLDATLGPRKAIVTVNAELDFDQTQTDAVEHTPTAGTTSSLPLSVHEKAESYTGSGGGMSGGIAGTGSNLSVPSYASGGQSSGGGAFKGDDTTTTYMDNTRHTVSQKAPGAIKSLSVAALIDIAVPAAEAAGIKDILSAAVGAVPGDTTRFVTVRQMPFDTSALKAENSAMQTAHTQQLWTNIAAALAVCVVVGFLLFLLMRPTRRVQQTRMALSAPNIDMLERSTDSEIDQILEERPLRIEDVLAEMPDAPVRRPKRRAHAPSIEEQQNLKMESIQEMINGNPEAVALLLKGWMAEEARVA